MTMNPRLSLIAAAVACSITTASHSHAAVKVFILAGQSNMLGAGRVEGDPNHNEGKGSLSYIADNDPTYKHLRKGSDGWVERRDVDIWFLGQEGGLAPGYGSGNSTIGPELGFGHVVGDAIDEQVLLIKTAWGGKSLAVDFRPPSAGGIVGPYYTEMIQHVRRVLAGLKSGYEIAGFAWHQGWNDGCDMGMTQEYEENLKHLIRDIRKEFQVDKLPFVIADSGFGGATESSGRRFMIREAQAAPPKSKEFKGNVICVETGSFHRPPEESPSGQGYHWNGNAETYYLIGEAMGKAMLELMGTAGPSSANAGDIREFRSADGSKSFKGRLMEYDPATRLVSVRRFGGKLIKFKLEFLHADDQAFVTGQTAR